MSNNNSGNNPQQYFNWSIPGWTYVTIHSFPSAASIESDMINMSPELSANSSGRTCKKCETFYEYAEPNQDDGTLICWACRHGY